MKLIFMFGVVWCVVVRVVLSELRCCSGGVFL